MDKPEQISKTKPDLKTGLIGLSMFGLGALTLIPALFALAFIGSFVLFGVRFVISIISLLL